ncbi:MAG: AbrB/MazE/SpoVT family DNA-binding domain-containing protein [Bacillota bacterium]|jgi:transcriptional pleiotropic regulator of transition state genes|nr:AbrB family transcriptional regulator [Bacillota bacterium]HPZ54507.1 AbrB/MazE/SpoVT family DNA-binding domain-containing protein [Bacillota bacterium]
MKYTGIVRRLDDMGRIIIPIELRRQRRIRRGVRLEVTLEGDRVVLRRHGPFCVFCDSAEDLRPFRGKHVCYQCIMDAR